jgi:hypothetical protein
MVRERKKVTNPVKCLLFTAMIQIIGNELVKIKGLTG